MWLYSVFSSRVRVRVHASVKKTGFSSRDIFSDIFYAEKMLGENIEKARRVLGPTHEVSVDMHRTLTLLRKLIAHLRAARETP